MCCGLCTLLRWVIRWFFGLCTVIGLLRFVRSVPAFTNFCVQFFDLAIVALTWCRYFLYTGDHEGIWQELESLFEFLHNRTQ